MELLSIITTSFILNTIYRNLIKILYLSLLIIFFLLALWGGYRFIALGYWEAVPPQIGASIIGGVFAIITLLWGNFLNNQKKREEAEYLRKSEFYEEIINKLYYFITFPDKVKNREEFYHAMNDLVGKIYTQGSDKLIDRFGEIIELLQEESSQEISQIPIIMQNIIHDIRIELGKYSKSTKPDKIFNSKIYTQPTNQQLP